MAKFLSNLIKNCLKGGFRIGYSSGKPFDPRDQERTDAMDDITKKEKAKTKKMLDKIFGIKTKEGKDGNDS